MVKICYSCGKEKDESLFCKKATAKDGLDYRCKKCKSIWEAEYYQNNKEYFRIRNAKARDKIRKRFREFKSTLKCIKCGEDHIACLDFHHRDLEKKEMSIGHAVSRCLSRERLLKEVEKCDVLCANCHRKLHWKSD